MRKHFYRALVFTSCINTIYLTTVVCREGGLVAGVLMCSWLVVVHSVFLDKVEIV